MTSTSRSVDFWFEFASTYSYLSAMRIEAEADRRGVSVHWRPFLLGPVFQAQGWDTSPFAIYPSKGRNMWRDMERRADKYGLTFRRPPADGLASFPQHSVRAARVATVALEKDWGRAYCRAVYTAQFAEGRNISDPDVIKTCIASVGGDAGQVMALADTEPEKSVLRQNTEAAMAQGLFGAPSFVVDDELFWGDDRLEDALDWAAQHVAT